MSLGTGKHVNEVRFSVLSAARFLSEAADWRILIYTDDQLAFAGLPVSFQLISRGTARDWAGPQDYVYRSKIIVLADSLREQGSSKSVIVDGDTYFRRSPAELFERIAPGTSLMHVREGRPNPPEALALGQVIASGQPRDHAGEPWNVLTSETIWNSGVVGLSQVDVGYCDEALSLTDQLLTKGFGEYSHIAEMAALGVVLSRRTVIREAFDVVTHYWPTEAREAFGLRLSAASRSEGGIVGRYDALWNARPTESLSRRAKFRVKRLLHRLGVEL